MEIRYETLIIVLGTVIVTKAQDKFMPLSPALLSKSTQACLRVAKEPYFSPDLVTGKPWRIYYTWNMKLGETCVDAHYLPATPEIIRRVYYDMYLSLTEQPTWEFASLLMIMGKNRQEVLLVPNTAIPGRFLAVNNDASDLLKRQIPLLKLQMKLFRNGKYLLFMDCQVGIAWLGMRFDEMPYRIDIESVVSDLMPYLGEGHQACTKEKNLLEEAATPENAHKKPKLIEK